MQTGPEQKWKLLRIFFLFCSFFLPCLFTRHTVLPSLLHVWKNKPYCTETEEETIVCNCMQKCFFGTHWADVRQPVVVSLLDPFQLQLQSVSLEETLRVFLQIHVDWWSSCTWLYQWASMVTVSYENVSSIALWLWCSLVEILRTVPCTLTRFEQW